MERLSERWRVVAASEFEAQGFPPYAARCQADELAAELESFGLAETWIFRPREAVVTQIAEWDGWAKESRREERRVQRVWKRALADAKLFAA